MQLSINRGIVDLNSPRALCHETVFNYCKDVYKSNYKFPDTIKSQDYSKILWDGIGDNNIITLANINLIEPGNIIGFFDQEMNCMHSMIALDYNTWVGTNNFYTFLCVDEKAVVFFQIDEYKTKQKEITVGHPDCKTSQSACSAHWNEKGDLWVLDSQGNIQTRKILYRNIIKNPIRYCSICEYK